MELVQVKDNLRATRLMDKVISAAFVAQAVPVEQMRT